MRGRRSPRGSSSPCRVLVVDPAVVDGDLVGDVTDVRESLHCRRGAAAGRVRRAVEAAAAGDVS